MRSTNCHTSSETLVVYVTSAKSKQLHWLSGSIGISQQESKKASRIDDYN